MQKKFWLQYRCQNITLVLVLDTNTKVGFQSYHVPCKGFGMPGFEFETFALQKCLLYEWLSANPGPTRTGQNQPSHFISCDNTCQEQVETQFETDNLYM